jgi:hypothetical protein
MTMIFFWQQDILYEMTCDRDGLRMEMVNEILKTIHLDLRKLIIAYAILSEKEKVELVLNELGPDVYFQRDENVTDPLAILTFTIAPPGTYRSPNCRIELRASTQDITGLVLPCTEWYILSLWFPTIDDLLPSTGLPITVAYPRYIKLINEFRQTYLLEMKQLIANV